MNFWFPNFKRPPYLLVKDKRHQNTYFSKARQTRACATALLPTDTQALASRSQGEYTQYSSYRPFSYRWSQLPYRRGYYVTLSRSPATLQESSQTILEINCYPGTTVYESLEAWLKIPQEDTQDISIYCVCFRDSIPTLQTEHIIKRALHISRSESTQWSLEKEVK